MMTAHCTSWLSPWWGLHDDNHRIWFQGSFQVNTALLSDPLESLTLHLLTMKITLCTIIACVHFQFLEQVHGQKVSVSLYLKIITAFQDFSYLFDEMLVLEDGATNWQRENLLIPTILLCSATSCESPHSRVSIFTLHQFCMWWL